MKIEQDQTDRLLTRQEVADYFRCCPATIRNYEKMGYFPRVELSDHRVRYRQSDIEKCIQKKTRLRAC